MHSQGLIYWNMYYSMLNNGEIVDIEDFYHEYIYGLDIQDVFIFFKYYTKYILSLVVCVNSYYEYTYEKIDFIYSSLMDCVYLSDVPAEDVYEYDSDVVYLYSIIFDEMKNRDRIDDEKVIDRVKYVLERYIELINSCEPFIIYKNDQFVLNRESLSQVSLAEYPVSIDEQMTLNRVASTLMIMWILEYFNILPENLKFDVEL